MIYNYFRIACETGAGTVTDLPASMLRLTMQLVSPPRDGIEVDQVDLDAWRVGRLRATAPDDGVGGSFQHFVIVPGDAALDLDDLERGFRGAYGELERGVAAVQAELADLPLPAARERLRGLWVGAEALGLPGEPKPEAAAPTTAPKTATGPAAATPERGSATHAGTAAASVGSAPAHAAGAVEPSAAGPGAAGAVEPSAAGPGEPGAVEPSAAGAATAAAASPAARPTPTPHRPRRRAPATGSLASVVLAGTGGLAAGALGALLLWLPHAPSSLGGGIGGSGLERALRALPSEGAVATAADLERAVERLEHALSAGRAAGTAPDVADATARTAPDVADATAAVALPDVAAPPPTAGDTDAPASAADAGSSAAPAPRIQLFSNPHLRMRSSPEVTRDNELVVLKGGVPLIVLDETDAWLQVRTDDDDPVTGWVAKDFVRLGERLVLAPE